jgi:NACalpha-BTF3-like transcription factor
MSCGCGCTQSKCKTYLTSLDCQLNILSGSDGEIIFNLFEQLGSSITQIDLNNIQSIDIIIFDVRDKIFAHFEYPDSTSVINNVTLLQHFNTSTNSIDDKGKISIYLTEDLLKNAMFGPLFAEIKLVLNQDNVQKNIIINCINIGTYKQSKIQKFLS